MEPERGWSSHLKADVVLLLTTALWGFTFVVVKDSLAEADPFTFLVLRFGVGALAAAAIARGGLRHWPSVRSGLILGVFLWLGYSFQTTGLEHTTPSRSAFITGMTVVLVPFVSILLFKRRPKPFALVGVVLATLGLYWLTLYETQESRGTLYGDLLTLGCAVGYAFHIAFNERFAPRGKVMTMVAVQLAVVAVLSALFLPFVEVKLSPTPALWVGVAITGLLASTLAIGAQTWAQARTSAIRAALIYSLEPVFAATYSILLGRESLGLREAIGGGLIILGVLISEVGGILWERFSPRAAAPES